MFLSIFVVAATMNDISQKWIKKREYNRKWMAEKRKKQKIIQNVIEVENIDSDSGEDLIGEQDKFFSSVNFQSLFYTFTTVSPSQSSVNMKTNSNYIGQVMMRKQLQI